jgi:hypothetical protein
MSTLFGRWNFQPEAYVRVIHDDILMFPFLSSVSIVRKKNVGREVRFPWYVATFFEKKI